MYLVSYYAFNYTYITLNNLFSIPKTNDVITQIILNKLSFISETSKAILKILLNSLLILYLFLLF